MSVNPFFLVVIHHFRGPTRAVGVIDSGVNTLLPAVVSSRESLSRSPEPRVRPRHGWNSH